MDTLDPLRWNPPSKSKFSYANNWKSGCLIVLLVRLCVACFRRLTFHLAVAAKLFFGPNMSIQRRTIRGILDPLGSKECNVHLLIFLLDAIVVTLFPELALSPSSRREQSDGATDAELDAMIYSPYDKSDPLDGRPNSPGQGTP